MSNAFVLSRKEVLSDFINREETLTPLPTEIRMEFNIMNTTDTE